MNTIFSASPRRLTICSLDWGRPKDPAMSLGHASIVANLHDKNIKVFEKSWAINNGIFNVDSVCEFAMEHASDKTDFALGAFVWNEKYIQSILNKLRKEGYPGRIILGGPQISYTKKNLDGLYPDADIFIRGYGEQALARLATSISDFPVIRGVHYANNPDLALSANVDLEALPSPYLEGYIKPQPFIRWETQRGCPFKCSFCQHRESDISMKRRGFSKTRIFQEADWLTTGSIINDIAVLDPTFNSGPNYLSILDRFIENGYKGKLSLQCRIEMVKPVFLEKVEALNKTATVVLEFGLQTVIKSEMRVINRMNNLTAVENIFNETKQRNILTEVSLIFGLPFQTVDTFKSSIEFCMKLGVPTIYAYPLMLLRGTPLHDEKQKYGLIESTEKVEINCEHRKTEEIPHVIESPSFTYEDWLQMAEIARGLDSYNKNNKGSTHTDGNKMQDTLMHTFWRKQKDNTKTLPKKQNVLSHQPNTPKIF